MDIFLLPCAVFLLDFYGVHRTPPAVFSHCHRCLAGSIRLAVDIRSGCQPGFQFVPGLIEIQFKFDRCPRFQSVGYRGIEVFLVAFHPDGELDWLAGRIDLREKCHECILAAQAYIAEVVSTSFETVFPGHEVESVAQA